MPDKLVLVGIASIPERVKSLEQVVAALSPQVHRIHVSLNDYTEVPSFLSAYPHLTYELKPDNQGDAEKFAAVDDWDGYVVTCDDDILYPSDYIQTLIDGIERYGRQCAVGFHGGTTLGWNGSAVAASHKRVQCLRTLLEDDTDINVLGTGAMAYHAGTVAVWRDAFRHANMADVQMACHARTLGIPFVGLAHNEGWLIDICPPLEEGRRIYTSNRTKDGSKCDTHLQREIEIKRFNWLEAPPKRPTVRVSIATCQRHAELAEVIEDLERESRWVDLEVCVYEDPMPPRFNYEAIRAKVLSLGWQWRQMDRHLGRKEFHRLVNQQMRDAECSDAEWFIFMPDDVRLVRHAIPKAITTWYRLEDPATLTLWRLQSLEGLCNWTGCEPVEGADATEIHHVDGFYLCKRDTLQALDFECGRPKYMTPTGSGTGRTISYRLHDQGKRMYRVNSSLGIANDTRGSVMNRRERMKHPTVTL